MQYRVLVLASLLFLFGSDVRTPCQVPSSQVARQDGAAPDFEDRYRIGFQDTLEIQVFRHPDLTQRVNVNPNGVIFLPRLDRPMIAACKTERELASDIAKEYQSFLKNPFVNVVVVEQRSQSFGVIGAVEKPGNFFVNRRPQLLELLAMAGGPSKEAGNRLIIARTGASSACRRPGEQVTEISFSSYRIRDVQEGKVSVALRPGDVVSVLDADVVYVYGSVRKPGEVKMKEPLTLRQALATAEGFTGSASRDNIRVLRQLPDGGDWVETKYDLGEIDRGKVRDPILNPNDIVAVSNDSLKAIIQGLARSATGGIGNIPLIVR